MHLTHHAIAELVKTGTEGQGRFIAVIPVDDMATVYLRRLMSWHLPPEIAMARLFTTPAFVEVFQLTNGETGVELERTLMEDWKIVKKLSEVLDLQPIDASRITIEIECTLNHGLVHGVSVVLDAEESDKRLQTSLLKAKDLERMEHLYRLEFP